MADRSHRGGLFNTQDALHLSGTAVADALTEDVLRRVIRRLLRALGAQAAMVCLRGEDGESYFIKCSAGISKRNLRAYPEKMRVGRSLVSAAGSCGRILVASGPELSPFAERLLFPHNGSGVAAALPLPSGGRVFGVLLICRDGAAFAPQEMELMKAVVEQVAMTIENVTLLEILHRGKNEWEKTVDAIKDLVVILDLKAQIIRVNRAFARAFHRRPQWMIGRDFFSVVYGRRSVPENCPVRRTLTTGKATEAQLQFARLRGIYQVSTAALSTAGGDFAGAVVLARDMTEWTELQRQLAQAEKLSAIGELVAGVSHEINNPLTAILGYTDLLLESELPPGVSTDLMKIHAQASRMHRIVQNLLRFAREDKAEMSLVDVNAVISSAMELVAYEFKAANIRVEEQFSPGLPLISGNANQLQQVFLNIINNAHQAMKNQKGQGRLLLNTGVAGGCVRVIISDTGPGIPREHQSRIFDPFFTTKPVGEGTGLGLSLSFGIIKGHRGSVRVESLAGQGATFLIDLPLPGESRGE